LNIWEPPQNDRPRNKLWDRDVVEFFLGSDWSEIQKYREFEIAPTGDWIDLAIDLSRKSYDRNWRSGWKTTARIDEEGAHLVRRRPRPANIGQRSSRQSGRALAHESVPHRRRRS
jgi:hypothetical protein